MPSLAVKEWKPKRALPPMPVHSLLPPTMDDGSEKLLLSEPRVELGTNTYFADFSSTWKRGTNQPHDAHVRHCFSEGIDFVEASGTQLEGATVGTYD